jgi:hypothetical protein
LCCAGFTLLLGGRHADKQFIWRPCPECHEASKHHLLKFGFLLLVRFNLGFTTEGRPATVLLIPSFWGSQRAVTYKPSMATPPRDVWRLMLHGVWPSRDRAPATASEARYGRASEAWISEFQKSIWCVVPEA